MKVVLLAAGRSNRMKPIQDKNFLMFYGKSLIEHQLDQLYEAGLRDFVIIGGKHNLGKLEEKITEWAKKKAKQDELLKHLKFVEQENLNEGMAGAMKSAEPFLDENGILIVSSNDIVESEAYKKIITHSLEGDTDGLIIGRKVEKYFPGGYLILDNQNYLTGIVEKPGAGNEPSDVINLVLHFHRDAKTLLKYLHKVTSSKDDLYETALEQMFKDHMKFKVVEYDGFWQAIKYPWHILEAAKFFFKKVYSEKKEKISAQATVSANVFIKGEVIVEEGVKIFENAVIQGPCYIGKNSIIANNALVRESFLGEGCVVGYITEIARSFLGNNVWTHSNYVGDSIIGNNVSFGAGTVTGNLRLDEKNIGVTLYDGEKVDTGKNKFGLITGDNVRCGINVSFMPGVRIGNNCFIGAGISVAQDIEDNKFVYGKTELVIKENLASINEESRKNMMKNLEDK